MDVLLITLLVVAISCFTLVVIMPLRWLAGAILGDRISSGFINAATGAIFVIIGFVGSLLMVAGAAGT